MSILNTVPYHTMSYHTMSYCTLGDAFEEPGGHEGQNYDRRPYADTGADRIVRNGNTMQIPHKDHVNTT